MLYLVQQLFISAYTVAAVLIKLYLVGLQSTTAAWSVTLAITQMLSPNLFFREFTTILAELQHHMTACNRQSDLQPTMVLKHRTRHVLRYCFKLLNRCFLLCNSDLSDKFGNR